jgi:hypothetical protein
MSHHAHLPTALGLQAHTGKPRGSVPSRDHAPVAFEESARLMEAALTRAVRDPAMLGHIGAALGRMGRDAGTS